MDGVRNSVHSQQHGGGGGGGGGGGDDDAVHLCGLANRQGAWSARSRRQHRACCVGAYRRIQPT